MVPTREWDDFFEKAGLLGVLTITFFSISSIRINPIVKPTRDKKHTHTLTHTHNSTMLTLTDGGLVNSIRKMTIGCLAPKAHTER